MEIRGGDKALIVAVLPTKLFLGDADHDDLCELRLWRFTSFHSLATQFSRKIFEEAGARTGVIPVVEWTQTATHSPA